MFLVLDFASIETDDNPVVSAVANFDEYRAEELEWLERTAGEWLAGAFDADRLVVVCHVPYGIRAERYYPEFSHALISLTERMGGGSAHRRTRTSHGVPLPEYRDQRRGLRRCRGFDPQRRLSGPRVRVRIPLYGHCA